MGFCQRGAFAFYRAGQARAKCVHRKFQREVPGRMLEPELVREPGRSQAGDRGLAGGLQYRAPTQQSGVSKSGGNFHWKNIGINPTHFQLRRTGKFSRQAVLTNRKMSWPNSVLPTSISLLSISFTLESKSERGVWRWVSQHVSWQ